MTKSVASHFAACVVGLSSLCLADDTLPLEWVEQVAHTDRYSFELGVRTYACDRYDDSVGQCFFIDSILVRRRADSSVMQRLWGNGSMDQSGDPSKALWLQDVDFNGDLDLGIFGQSGGASPNNTNIYFRYRGDRENFVYDSTLSELCQIKFHPKSKRITSASRGGCCSHSYETWRWVRGSLVLSRSVTESLTADGKWMKTATGFWKNGVWVESVKRKRYTEPDFSQKSKASHRKSEK